MADPSDGTKFWAIAYTIVITQDGSVNLCHDLGDRPWHSAAVVGGKGRNYTHVGICYTGNMEPNAAQLVGIRGAIQYVQDELGRALSVEGHRDAPYATACPGPKWPAWKAAVLP